MRFLLSPDSYKGSLTAKEVAEVMESAIINVCPMAEIVKFPIADGGEGTVEALTEANDGEFVTVRVTGPAQKPVLAKYGVFDQKQTAVIEMAEASGLTKMSKKERNPLKTTSFGTGELIKHALGLGCKRIIVGVGGSATNDGGVGMAQALGVNFYDQHGQEIGLGGAELSKIDHIDISRLDPRIRETEIIIASDVTNPLCGKEGASYVFGPQKGATETMVAELDRGLMHFANKIKEQLHVDVLNKEGAGAGGGIGAGLMAFLQGNMKKGIDVVLEFTNLEKTMKDVDVVFTGEGYTDEQTKYGKAPVGVALLAKKYEKPVICVSGGVSNDVSELYRFGIDVAIGTVQAPMSVEDAMKHAKQNLYHATSSIVRALFLCPSFRSLNRHHGTAR